MFPFCCSSNNTVKKDVDLAMRMNTVPITVSQQFKQKEIINEYILKPSPVKVVKIVMPKKEIFWNFNRINEYSMIHSTYWLSPESTDWKKIELTD